MAISAIIGALAAAAPAVIDLFSKGKGGSSGSSGSGAGGGLGSVIAPMAMGASQAIQGAMNRKKARGMEPLAEDPQVRMNLARIQRQSQALRSGTQTSVLSQQLQKSSQQAQLNALKIGGISGLSAASRARGAETQALVKLSQQNLEAAQQQDVLASNIIQKMATRKLGIDRERQGKLEVIAESQISGGQQNIAAAVASMGGATPESVDDSNLGNTTSGGSTGNDRNIISNGTGNGR